MPTSTTQSRQSGRVTAVATSAEARIASITRDRVRPCISFHRLGLSRSEPQPGGFPRPLRHVAGSAGVDGVMSTAEVAEAVVQTLRAESFLCLPHPEVLGYLQRKTADYDRWLGGMQKMFARHAQERP